MYNDFKANEIRGWLRTGQGFAKDGRTIDDLCNVYRDNFRGYELASIGYQFPDWDVPRENKYYRFGEPRMCYGRYMPSYNHMTDRPEVGVSIIDSKWLDGGCAFFDVDSAIKTRGVWEIWGVKLPVTGGDGEPLIIPVNWARKTSIKTLRGLKIAVKQVEIEDEGG